MALTSYIEQEMLKFFLNRSATIPSAYYLGLGLYDTSNPGTYSAWAEDGSTSGTEPSAGSYSRAPLTFTYDGSAERSQSRFKTQDPILFDEDTDGWITAGSTLCFGYAAVFDAATGGNVIAALNLPRPAPGTPWASSIGKKVSLNGGITITLLNGDYAAGSGDAAYFGLDAGVRAALGKQFFLGTSYPYTRSYLLGLVGQKFLGSIPSAVAMSSVLASCEYTDANYARKSLVDADWTAVGYDGTNAIAAYAKLQTAFTFGGFAGGSGNQSNNFMALIDTGGNCVALAAPVGNFLIGAGPSTTGTVSTGAGDTVVIPANTLYLYLG
jgi:hypothetical protein